MNCQRVLDELNDTTSEVGEAIYGEPHEGIQMG